MKKKARAAAQAERWRCDPAEVPRHIALPAARPTRAFDEVAG